MQRKSAGFTFGSVSDRNNRENLQRKKKFLGVTQKVEMVKNGHRLFRASLGVLQLLK